MSGMYLFEYTRSDFRVEAAIKESSLTYTLDREAQERLAVSLRQGERVEFELLRASRRQHVFVEADPSFKRLRLTDSNRKVVELPGLLRPVRADVPAFRQASRRR